MENSGATQVNLPEKIWWGALFIFAAAVVDFLDGFLARLLKAPSEMGKQLDSLSDVVSFGVAPGMILYQLLRMSYAQEENGLDVSMLALLPAFIHTAAAAWRLAKFNIAYNQSYSFIGVPSPAAGLLVASFPLILWNPISNPELAESIRSLFLNKWLLYAVIILVSYLMVCNRTFLAIKFTDFSVKNNLLKYILLSLSLIALVALKWLAIPIIFIIYLVISMFSKEPQKVVTGNTVQK
jgi:CDP-diacylglycerol--serine O-phosphatidyltransferase